MEDVKRTVCVPISIERNEKWSRITMLWMNRAFFTVSHIEGDCVLLVEMNKTWRKANDSHIYGRSIFKWNSLRENEIHRSHCILSGDFQSLWLSDYRDWFDLCAAHRLWFHCIEIVLCDFVCHSTSLAVSRVFVSIMVTKTWCKRKLFFPQLSIGEGCDWYTCSMVENVASHLSCTVPPFWRSLSRSSAYRFGFLIYIYTRSHMTDTHDTYCIRNVCSARPLFCVGLMVERMSRVFVRAYDVGVRSSSFLTVVQKCAIGIRFHVHKTAANYVNWF